MRQPRKSTLSHLVDFADCQIKGAHRRKRPAQRMASHCDGLDTRVGCQQARHCFLYLTLQARRNNWSFLTFVPSMHAMPSNAKIGCIAAAFQWQSYNLPWPMPSHIMNMKDVPDTIWYRPLDRCLRCVQTSLSLGNLYRHKHC